MVLLVAKKKLVEKINFKMDSVILAVEAEKKITGELRQEHNFMSIGPHQRRAKAGF